MILEKQLQRLFRAKDVDREVWVYGGYIPGYIYSFDLHDLTDPKTKDKRIAIYNKTVGQYSSLNDSGCNRIFEGDILLAQNMEDKYWYVEFCNGQFVVISIKYGQQISLYSFLCSTYANVVGNIHDNPEYFKR